MSRAVLVIPIKRICNCKTRLSITLPRALRAKLSLAMLRDIIDAALNSNFINDVVIVSRDPWELYISDPRVKLLKDYWGREDLAVYRGIEYSFKRLYADRVAVCVSDAPLTLQSDLDCMVESVETGSLVLSPSLDGGTNILAFKPPLKITLAYGYMSFYKHYAKTIEAGLKPIVYVSARTLIDIDTRRDLVEAYKLCSRDNALSCKRTCRLLQEFRGVFLEDNDTIGGDWDSKANRGFQEAAPR